MCGPELLLSSVQSALPGCSFLFQYACALLASLFQLAQFFAQVAKNLDVGLCEDHCPCVSDICTSNSPNAAILSHIPVIKQPIAIIISVIVISVNSV